MITIKRFELRSFETQEECSMWQEVHGRNQPELPGWYLVIVYRGEEWHGPFETQDDCLIALRNLI